MEQDIKILIVEDEMLLAAEIELHLKSLGYHTLEIFGSGEEALDYLKAGEQPDIILMDIQLDGELDGIGTVEEIKKRADIPVIFLTANSDNGHFDRAKITRPEAFISKPFKKMDLERAIELTVEKINSRNEKPVSDQGQFIPFLLSDFIYVKNRDRMVKVIIHDILYIEAERNYSRICTKDKDYLLVMTLKDLESKLPSPHFLRIHRSYVINITKIDELTSSNVIIETNTIPISKNSRDELLKRLPTI